LLCAAEISAHLASALFSNEAIGKKGTGLADYLEAKSASPLYLAD
jgi:hypothetical protein